MTTSNLPTTTSPNNVPSNPDAVTNILWPLNGILYFMGRPKLWFGPIAYSVLAWLIAITTSFMVLWYCWPAAEVTGIWAQSMGILSALAFACLSFVSLWLLGIPFLVSFSFERLLYQILTAQHIDISNSESVIKSTISTTGIFLRGLPWRLLWLSSSLLFSLIFPPLGIILGAVGLGHSCILEGCENVLLATGKDGATRRLFYKQFRGPLLLAGIVAGASSILLSFTVIGLLFWLPGVLCATALTIPHWKIDEPS